MSKYSSIEWTDATWNPWRGCHKVSAGCKHCYMFREQIHYGADPNVIVRSKTTFSDPLKWTEPKRIFTCSWSDFFIEEADEWRDEAWEIIRQTPQHTYQILTKRPERIGDNLPGFWMDITDRVWLGVSIEDRKSANTRLPILLKLPAHNLFLSCEPLLGLVDLVQATPDLEDGWDYVNYHWDDSEPEEFIEECEAELDWVNFGDDLVYNPEYREWIADRKRGAKYHTFRLNIGWVIVGGESGAGCRPMENEWAQSIVDLCQDMKIPVFVKQLGGFPNKRNDITQFPEELRVRQYP